MSMQTVAVGILALVCGVSAAMLINRMQNEPVQAVTAVETMPVIVTSIDVDRGTKLSKEMLGVREWPKDMVPAGAVTDMEKALEGTASMPLIAGELLMEGKMSPLQGIVSVIPEGMRAVTIMTPTAATGVAGFILPGNRVDILLTVRGGADDDGTGGGWTQTLLQNIEVLAVEDLMDAPSEKRVQKMASVTLACWPDVCSKLSLAEAWGTLTLTLRRGDDNLDAEPPVITMRELKFAQEEAVVENDVGPLPPPAPALPEPAPRAPEPPRTVIVKRTIPEIKIRTIRGRGVNSVIIRPGQEIEEEVPVETAEDDYKSA